MSRKSLVLTQIVTLMVLSLAALLWLTLLAGNAAQAPASSGPQRPDEASAQTAL